VSGVINTYSGKLATERAAVVTSANASSKRCIRTPTWMRVTSL
jgi:hypothetical protein